MPASAPLRDERSPASPIDRRLFVRRAVAIAVIALLVAAWVPFHLALPLPRDQGIFAWVAEEMLRGRWPYTDIWDHKAPLTYALYAAMFAIFGPHDWAVRVLDVALLGLGTTALAVAARRLAPTPRAGLVAAAVAVAAFFGDARLDFWKLGQPDAWIACLIAVPTALLLDPARRARTATAIALGLAVGLCVAMKPNHGLLLALAATWWADPAIDGRRRRRLAAVAAGTAALPPIAVLAPFAATGRLGDLFDVVVRFNGGPHVRQLGYTLLEYPVWLAHALLVPEGHLAVAAFILLAVAGFACVLRRDRVAAAVLGTGWLASLLGALVQHKFFTYHFVPMALFTALLVAVAIVDGVPRLHAWADRRGAFWPKLAPLLLGLVGGVALSAGLWGLGTQMAAWWSLDGDAALARYEREWFCPYPHFCLPDVRAAAATAARLSLPGEPIFVWGFDALIYHLADRPSASRFGFSYPAVVDDVAMRERVRAELMADLARRPPRVIVVAEGDSLRLMKSTTSRAYLEGFPALAALIGTRYREVERSAFFSVHRRVD